MKYKTAILTLFLTIGATAYADSGKDRLAIMSGVKSLSAPGCLPGPIAVSSRSAFVLVTGKSGKQLLPVAGAAYAGRGKAIAVGHEGFFGEQALSSPDNSRFLMNSLSWLSGRQPGKLRVGLLDMPGIRRTVEAAGGIAETLEKSDIPAKMSRYNVLCLNQGVLDGQPDKQKAVAKYIQDGGGVLIAGPAWGWMYGAGGRSLAKDHTGNAVLRSFGLGFADGGLDGPFSPEGNDNPLLNAETAMSSLKQENLDPTSSLAALKAIESLLSTLPSDDKRFLPRIEALAKQESTNGGPTAKAPITESMPFARLNAMLYMTRVKETAADNIQAHPSASSFPGPIPAGAPRVSQTITIDTRVPEWHGTGLYAAPGEQVTIEIPVEAAKSNLGVRVGCHTDTLWGLTSWTRFPEISTYSQLKSEKTTVANPFGGTIFIDVPGNCKLGQIQVSIRNAVAQPRFVKGKTSLSEWRQSIRNNPAPWAELEGDLVILSVPSTSVRDLDDPEALMAYWDRVMEACYKVYAEPKRNRPERYCVDRQISAGYMHSGYPIMTWEDVAKTFCDLPKLSQKGSHLWGFYHEMGHNFQKGAWTFDGTGEVTNNLFSLYGQEAVVGLKPEEFGLAHPALKEPEISNRLKKYLDGGAKFSDWQNDPFLALTMYVQMRRAFGWEPMTKVFKSYWTGSQPADDQQRRDEWMVRMSNAVGKNLGPFFVAWGVPTSEKARASVSALPKWMPADWPAK